MRRVYIMMYTSCNCPASLRTARHNGISAGDAGLVTYRANAASPVFQDLRAIVEKTSGIDAMIRDALERARRKIRLALIYGSIAKGTNCPDPPFR